MSADDAKNADTVLNLGFDYADKAWAFFSEKHGDKPTLGQLSSFGGAAGATMLGTMYAIVTLNAGPEEAEAWLARMFSLLAAVVRQKGIPVSLTIRATTTPVALPEQPGAAPVPSEAAAAAPSCTCSLDRDGICPTCPPAIRELFTKAISILLPFVRSMSELKRPDSPSCKACDGAYLDAAVASAIFRGALSETGKAEAVLLDQVFFMIVQFGAQRGVSEMPLSEQAWGRFMEKLGVPGDKTA